MCQKTSVTLRSLVPVLFVVSGTACGDVNASRASGGADDGTPPEARGLHIALEATPREIAPGEPAELVAVLTNRRSESARLRFDDSCQLLVYVEDHRSVRVVPYDGEWICLDVETTLALGPGESIRRPLVWTANRELYDERSAALPAGDYTAYATLEGRLAGETISLRSEPEVVTVAR